jgi:hypothetical protein
MDENEMVPPPPHVTKLVLGGLELFLCVPFRIVFRSNAGSVDDEMMTERLEL